MKQGITSFTYDKIIELDKKDEKIIIELEKNARLPISLLSKKVGLSRDVVKYRIKNLLKIGFIQGFTSVVNINKLGLKWYSILLKFENMSKTTETRLKKYIENEPYIRWSQKLTGEWDASVHLNVPSVLELNRILDKIKNITQGHLHDFEVLQGIKEYKYNNLVTGFLKSREKTYQDVSIEFPFGRFDEAEEKEEINEKDMQILEILSYNSRAPLIDIAKKVKLSSDSTNKRIQNLKKKKIIRGFNTVVNTPMQGCQLFVVLIQLKNANEKSKTELINNLRGSPFICHVSEFSGKFDLWVHIWARNPGHFESIFSGIKEKFRTMLMKQVVLLGMGEYKFGQPPFEKV